MWRFRRSCFSLKRRGGSNPCKKKRAPKFGALFVARIVAGGFELDSRLQYSLDWRDSRHLPLVPHCVDHLLNVGEVLLLEMIEAALLGEKFFHRDSSLARLARVPGVNDVPLHYFIERIDAAFDSQLAQLVGVARMIVPTLWTWIVGVDEGRAADGERLLDLVQII